MNTTDVTIWGINAGKGASAHKAADVHQLFLEKSYVAIGWAELGDLSKLVDDPGNLKAHLGQVYSSLSKAAVGQDATIVTQFVHDMHIGDIVVYRPVRSQSIHLGRVAGPYIYNRQLDDYYRHVRPVVWKCEIQAHDDLSSEAQNNFLVPRSLFRITSGRDEFQAAIVKAEQAG